jgi:hypothetical protein
VAEAAYDIWLNNWANEVMIQHDFVGDSLRPRCDQTGDVVASATFGGSGGVPVETWNLCVFGSEIIWQLPTGKNVSSSSVDVLAMLNWLVAKGYLPSGSVLDNGISWGFELCSTGGVTEKFQANGFTVTVAP